MPAQLEHWPIERLIDYARNPRRNDHAVDQMAAAIAEFDFRIPIVALSSGEVVDGHLRLKAARKLGLAQVPVVLADDLTDAQIKAFRLLANRSANWAEWDDALLVMELADLSDAGFDLDLTGFSASEIERLLDLVEDSDVVSADPEQETREAEPANDDEADDGDEDGGENRDDELDPTTQLTPVSRAGDVWIIGRHRLICGDAADPAVVATLMRGETAHLCITSPPYAQQRNYANGAIADWDVLMQGVFGAARAALREEAQLLINLGLVHRDNEVQPYWDGWIAWMREHGWRRFGWYVWDQGPGLPGDWNGRLAPSFEFVFHFNREARRPNKIVPCKYAGQREHLREDGTSTSMRDHHGRIGGWTHADTPTQATRIPDSVIRLTRQKSRIGRGIDHPAVFPIALPTFVIETFTDASEIVYEPFGGSGTTLMACERTGRVCRAVEIAAEYVDVAIERIRQQLPGVPVTLEATGQHFDAVSAERRGDARDAA